MPARLVALNEGPSLPLDKSIVLVGRHPDCDYQLDSVKVSRRHCCLALVNDCWVVRDLGSTNGVRINGRRVEHGRLSPGDELAIANFRYQFRVDDEKPRASASPMARVKPRPANNGSSSGGHSAPLDEALLSSEQPVILEEDEEPGPAGRAALPAIPPPSEIGLAPASDPQVELSRRRKKKR